MAADRIATTCRRAAVTPKAAAAARRWFYVGAVTTRRADEGATGNRRGRPFGWKRRLAGRSHHAGSRIVVVRRRGCHGRVRSCAIITMTHPGSGVGLHAVAAAARIHPTLLVIIR